MLNEKPKTQLLLKVGNKPVVFLNIGMLCTNQTYFGCIKFLHDFSTHRFACKHSAVFHLCHRSSEGVVLSHIYFLERPTSPTTASYALYHHKYDQNMHNTCVSINLFSVLQETRNLPQKQTLFWPFKIPISIKNLYYFRSDFKQ